MKIGEKIPVQESGLGLCDLCHKSEIEPVRPGELRDFYAANENGVDYVVCETCGNPQDTNGLIAWCNAGHVFEMPKTDARYSMA